jgi:hypothetical protein
VQVPKSQAANSVKLEPFVSKICKHGVAEAGNRSDRSFAVMEDGEPLLLVLCSLGMGALDWYGLPIRLCPREGLALATLLDAFDRVLAHLEMLAGESGARIVLGDAASQPLDSLLGHRCLVRGAAASVWLTGMADLTQGEAGMRCALRKSFKSLLNWGRQNLETRIVGLTNPDRLLFDRFQELHRSIAGHVTRPQPSWDMTYNWIAAGRGELVVNLLDGEMVGGTVVVDSGSVAGYATGAYNRSRFDKPLAHWPLWLAMLRSAERGMKAMDLGGLPLPPDATDKERSIGYFKRGFATSISVKISWACLPPEAR